MGSRNGLTLAERAAAAQAGQLDASAASPDRRERPVVQRHCWVQGVPDAPGRWPGLLVEWRQGPAASARSGWEGRVVYAVASGAGTCVLVEAWLPAEHLSPA